MATIGKLAVLIDADNSGLKAGLKDSVAQTEQSSQAIIKNVQAIASAFAGYLTVDMFAGMIKGAAEAGKQIDQLSKLSATSTTVFQQQAYAAQQFGISNEKLADIFKDVQDKVGQFLRDGGGPMQTFFEQIAPKVGVTAEQFRKLGGPEALQLYVNSLEKANLSQNEMTAYMEELASDSAMLLPLLRNNGAEMGRLADEAQRLGAVLSEETVKANKDFANQLDRLYSAANSLKVNIGSSLIPEITRLINEFNIGIKVAGGFWNALQLATINPFKTGSENIKSLREQLKGLQSDRERYLRANSDTYAIDAAIKNTETKINYLESLMRSSWNLSGQRLGMNDPRIIGTPAAAETAGYREPPKPAATGGGKTGNSEADKAQRDYEDFQRQAENDRFAYLRKRAEDAMAEEQMRRDSLIRRLESLKEYTKTEEQLTAERQAKQLEDLKLGLDNGLLTEQEYMLMRQDMELKHMEELARIRGDGMKKLQDISQMSWNEQLALTVGKIGEMTAAAASGSKAMFNINKAAAIANALLKAKESVTSAYAFGSKIGGPPLGAAMAGLAAAATAAQVSAIRSQQFGGGGSVSAGGSASAVAPTQTAAAGGAGVAQTITIQGVNSGDLFSGDAVRTLIDRLIDAQRNGARIVLA